MWTAKDSKIDNSFIKDIGCDKRYITFAWEWKGDSQVKQRKRNQVMESLNNGNGLEEIKESMFDHYKDLIANQSFVRITCDSMCEPKRIGWVTED